MKHELIAHRLNCIDQLIISFTTNQRLLEMIPLISKVKPYDAPKASISSYNDIDHCPTMTIARNGLLDLLQFLSYK